MQGTAERLFFRRRIASDIGFPTTSSRLKLFSTRQTAVARACHAGRKGSDAM
nr:MAG TPA: hypothetical protein [Myoviridae sp. ct5FH28]